MIDLPLQIVLPSGRLGLHVHESVGTAGRRHEIVDDEGRQTGPQGDTSP